MSKFRFSFDNQRCYFVHKDNLLQCKIFKRIFHEFIGGEVELEYEVTLNNERTNTFTVNEKDLFRSEDGCINAFCRRGGNISNLDTSHRYGDALFKLITV